MVAAFPVVAHLSPNGFEPYSSTMHKCMTSAVDAAKIKAAATQNPTSAVNSTSEAQLECAKLWLTETYSLEPKP